MKSLKELIKMKKFISLILSLFISVSGLLIFVFGLALRSVPNLSICVIIFSIILMFIGYIIPKTIIKLENDKKNKLLDLHNEIKETIKNLRDIKIANADEKQKYISTKKILKYMSIPMYLTFYILIGFSLLFIIIGVVKFNDASFFIFIGLLLLAVAAPMYYANKNKNLNYIQKIMDNTIYIADCYAYDKKFYKTHYNRFYFLCLLYKNNRWKLFY